MFRLQLEMPNVIALSDSVGGLILVRVAGDEAEVLTLCVRPAQRRRGLGSVLLQEAVVHVAALGVRVLFLEVSIKNTVAHALYQQFSFVPVGRRPRYYSDGSDALVLRLDLPGAAPDMRRNVTLRDESIDD